MEWRRPSAGGSGNWLRTRRRPALATFLLVLTDKAQKENDRVVGAGSSNNSTVIVAWGGCAPREASSSKSRAMPGSTRGPSPSARLEQDEHKCGLRESPFTT